MSGVTLNPEVSPPYTGGALELLNRQAGVLILS